MRLHYLQHVPFETPGYCLDFARDHGHDMHGTFLYQSAEFPKLTDFDALIVMGGPMGVHDDDQYPWLTGEKEFLTRVIESGKKIMGICLGAQLLAYLLGADVVQNADKEIGWYSVEKRHPFFSSWQDREMVFHWHGDRFEIPDGADHLAMSAGCINQAFLYQSQILGLQFHLEATVQGIHALTAHCGNELVPGAWIQTKNEIERDTQRHVYQANKQMAVILDGWLTQ